MLFSSLTLYFLAPFSLSTGGGSDQPTETAGDTAFDGDIVPSSLAETVAPILRAANEVEKLNPRVAYLCRFYTFEVALRLDPTSHGRGVREFKTALLQRLEKDSERTSMERDRGNDALEMQSFYLHYTEKYIQALQNSDNEVQRAKLTKACETADVLSKVLKGVNSSQCTKVDAKGLSSTLRSKHQRRLRRSLLGKMQRHRKSLLASSLKWWSVSYARYAK